MHLRLPCRQDAILDGGGEVRLVRRFLAIDAKKKQAAVDLD